MQGELLLTVYFTCVLKLRFKLIFHIYHCLVFVGLYLWSGQKPWWNWYITSVVNFGEVRRAQLAKSTILTSMFVPLGSFRSFQMLKREWGVESNGKLPHLFIPGKTAALVPEFEVEDLPSAELQPRFLCLQLRTCLLGRILWWWYDDSRSGSVV